jgi:hypothetical protein
MGPDRVEVGFPCIRTGVDICPVHLRLVAIKKPHVHALTSDLENPELRIGSRPGNKLIFSTRRSKPQCGEITGEATRRRSLWEVAANVECLASEVHPRGCGEHPSPEDTQRRQVGSSPRVRGTQRFTLPFLVLNRFIPAGAGNTWRSQVSPKREAVHPRGCGEHRGIPAPLFYAVGSSPRVRGTQPSW